MEGGGGRGEFARNSIFVWGPQNQRTTDLQYTLKIFFFDYLRWLTAFPVLPSDS